MTTRAPDYTSRIAWGLFAVSLVFFLVHIQFPLTHNFDEFHYVPAAKELLSGGLNRNWEHPPLAKELMAIGIAIFGDRPLGWRFMSAIAGSATLSGMFAWALALFRERSIALWAALLTLVNQILYVQARIGMLDTFMAAFLIWGLVFFTLSSDPDRDAVDLRKLSVASGICFGLALACKWFAVIPWIASVALMIAGRFWKGTRAWKNLRWSSLVIGLGVVPLLAYFITFLPLFTLSDVEPSLGWILHAQVEMYSGQLRVVSPHPYMSHWQQWVLLLRPMWYAYDQIPGGEGVIRGVICLGNPLIMWAGLGALFACAWSLITTRSRDAFFILYYYGVFTLSWVLIPRKISFYYYYYPSALVLSLALAHVFFWGERGKTFSVPWARWFFFLAAFAIFVFFFPILAAYPIRAGEFLRWMWFRSWI